MDTQAPSSGRGFPPAHIFGPLAVPQAQGTEAPVAFPSEQAILRPEHSTAGKALAVHTAHPGSIPHIPEGAPSTARNKP